MTVMPLSHDEFLTAVEITTAAATAYYNGEVSLLTDEMYDRLVEEIEQAIQTNPDWATAEGVSGLLGSVGAGVANAGDVEHTVPMLSLAKKKEIADLEEFVKSVNTKVIVEPKVDGIAAIVRYVDGERVLVATRGDGTHGEDITSRINNLGITGLPKTLLRPLTFEVRGELFMSPEDMEFSNANRVAAGGEPFANPRNATSGTVMRETVRYAAQVSFAAYEVFGTDEREPAFSSDSYTERMKAASDLFINLAANLLTADVRKALIQDGIIAGVKALGVARSQGLIKAATDGCVVKVDSTAVRERLGAASRHPRWAMAYKYEAIRAESRLLDILRTVGRTGNIAYTAALLPTTVDGSVVERATLHNSAFIEANDLRIGDYVELFKAGDIIPRIEKPILERRTNGVAPDAYVAPTTCPQCDEELDRSSVIWRCETPSCGIVSLISYATSRDCLDVDGLSTAIATALVDGGWVEDLSDLFFIPRADLATLPMGITSTGGTRVLGKAVANKIADGLEAAKNQPLNRVICALGIRKTGRTMSRRIAAEFGSMDAVLAASENDFLRVEGVSDGKARYIYNGVQKMRADIERMRETGFTMQTSAPATASGDSLPLAGKKVVITGAMTGPFAGKNRTEAQEVIERLGGTASGSVSSSTSILICDKDSEGSSKWNKAKALGTVEILTPEEFAKMVGM